MSRTGNLGYILTVLGTMKPFSDNSSVFNATNTILTRQLTINTIHNENQNNSYHNYPDNGVNAVCE